MKFILHSDLNNFYASVECLYDPSIRNKCVAVVGDAEKRHGVVVARNYTAKDFGISVGDTVWQAKLKCADVVCVTSRLHVYKKISDKVKNIYKEYTQQVESFGIDEAWLDISNIANSFLEAQKIADEIRVRVINEIGLTVSIGVSFNKIFAKLGSDMKKPNGITLITPDNYKEKIWGLKAGDLLFVGRATKEKLFKHNINTIGDIYKAGKKFLSTILGKVGETLFSYASGENTDEVKFYMDADIPKSISRSTTTLIDLKTTKEVESVIYLLSEDIAKTLRDKNLLAGEVGISVKDECLESISHTMRLNQPTNLTNDIALKCVKLFKDNFSWNTCVRAVGVRVTMFENNSQCNMFANENTHMRMENLEKTIDKVRNKFGYNSLKRGIIFINPQVGDIERE